MSDEIVGRREFLKGAAGGVLGSAGMLAGFAEMAHGDSRVVHEVAAPGESYGQDCAEVFGEVCGVRDEP